MLTWRLRGTKYNRYYFQLRASVPPTTEIGYGLWPTPDASLATGGKILNREVSITGRTPEGKKRQVSINDYAKRGLLPTPTASITTGSKTPPNKQGGPSLHQYFAMLPTPGASDAKTGYMGTNREGKQQNMETVLRNAFLKTPTAHTMEGRKPAGGSQSSGTLAQQAETVGGSLNPRFVLEMMGFPSDWCDLGNTTCLNDATETAS
ncbi:hypothetical protein [Hymenobacter guriensis]|uniref:hypothetical protein n=1 Tax=Hymenobacter guriensis TaxID=2793065 RepID=UPI001E4FC34F|nr:hypothetical protein [Hymenobacter guriensis]